MNIYDQIYDNIRKAVVQAVKNINEIIKTIDFSEFEELVQGVSSLKQWHSAIKILSENQYAFTDEVTDEIIIPILDNKDVDDTVQEYYLSNNQERLDELLSRCEELIQPYNNSELLKQVIIAYKQGSYHLSCIGLFAIFDGLLSEVSKNHNTSYKARFDIIHKKINRDTPLSKLDKRLICLLYAFDNINHTAFKNSGSFINEDSEDTSVVNRHWTIHGRSRKEYEAIDCIKLFQWIEALIILDKFDTNNLEED